MITKIPKAYGSVTIGSKREVRPVSEYRGLSTDPLPEGAGNGDALVEMDTGVTRHYDEERGRWLPERPEGWEEAALDTVLGDLIPDDLIGDTESEEAAV